MPTVITMAMLYRFQIELSDIDRGVYESLDFRVSQHPSEALSYLLSRTLAFALSYQSNLEFSPKGLSDPDGPALQVKNDNGVIETIIEIGNPSPRKLHKLMKAVKQVIVYTYKNPRLLINEIKSNEVHRSEEIEIYPLDPKILLDLENHLQKNNLWSMLIQDGRLNIEIPSHSFTMELKKLTTNN